MSVWKSDACDHSWTPQLWDRYGPLERCYSCGSSRRSPDEQEAQWQRWRYYYSGEMTKEQRDEAYADCRRLETEARAAIRREATS